MTLNFQPSPLHQRKALFLPLCALGCYWAVLIYYLGAQWSVYEQYSYGWAVPFLCLYLLWRKVAQASSPAAHGSGFKVQGSRFDVRPADPSPPAPRPSPLHSSSIFYLLLAICALLYAPTRFLHEANPIWRLTSLLWTLEMVGLTLLIVHLAFGALAHQPSSFGLRASDFTFPLCFFLVAVPWPSGVENFLTQSLMRLNTATTVELLGFFGIPAVQHGSVIEVGTGIVGIDEACSGIRSLQATLMISLFLGELHRLAILRRLWLIVLGFVLAFAFNVGRTLLLTGIASARGIGAVASWHDPAGVTILVGCFLGLWGLALLLRGQRTEDGGQRPIVGSEKPEVGVSATFNSQPSTSSSPQLTTLNLHASPPSSLFPLRWVSAALLGWLLLVETGNELWYRAHEQHPASAKRWSLNTENRGQSFTKINIPSGIADQFCADESTHARWQDAGGNSWQLYYFRWFPAHALRQRVAIQLAKTHGPERCLPAVGMSLRSYLGIITVPVAGMELAMQQYVFNAEGRSLHVFYGIYEDPSGSTKLANRRRDCASRVAAALAGSRNYGQRYLELAVVGYEKPEDAKAALVGELRSLIKVEQ